MLVISLAAMVVVGVVICFLIDVVVGVGLSSATAPSIIEAAARAAVNLMRNMVVVMGVSSRGHGWRVVPVLYTSRIGLWGVSGLPFTITFTARGSHLRPRRRGAHACKASAALHSVVSKRSGACRASGTWWVRGGRRVWG
jgi:hypothetical protein